MQIRSDARGNGRGRRGGLGKQKADFRESMDTLNLEERSERMSRIRSKDTAPEMVVRRLVHGMGYRYRLHGKDLPGCPDLVFRTREKVIFVHGCYWHRHTDSACKLARLPKSRLDFWGPKLERNRQRDMQIQEKLKDMNWKVLVVWECELKNQISLKQTVKAFLDQ